MTSLFFIGANNPETRRMLIAVSRVSPGARFIGFIDNDPEKVGTVHCGLPVLGGYDALSSLNPNTDVFVNLITRDTRTRHETTREVLRRGFRMGNFIHPSIDLTDVVVGNGNYFQEAVVIQAGCVVGDNSSIHMASLIGHESSIGSSTFIAHGVTISGAVQIGNGVFIGAGSTIVPRVKIGNWATIGAGAVVIKDIPAGAVAVGNPAKILRTVEVPHDIADGNLAR